MSETNPVVGIMDDAIDLVRKANDRTYAADARIRELEAQCAAMREALVQLWIPFDRPMKQTVERALSGDAGRALLERVEAQDRRIAALESVAKAAREFRNAVAPMDYDAAAKALDYHLDALSYLDALEPKR